MRNTSRNKGKQTMIEFNRISQENYFSSKTIQKVRQGRLVPDLFLLFKKALYEV